MDTNDVSYVGTVYEQAAAHVRSGRAPLWFPEFSCGTPLAASGMYGLLYPGLALFLVLPLGAAWTWTAVLHLAAGAAGMHAFLRGRVSAPAAWAGAALFLLSEYLVGRVTCGHLNLVLPVCWVPWILLHVEGAVRGRRRAVPLLALCTGMGLLSGHLQLAAYLGPLVAAFAVAEVASVPHRFAALLRLATGLALGLGIAAVQLVLTAELAENAAPTPVDAAQMRNVSVPPAVLASKLAGALQGPAPAAGDLDFRHEFRGIAGLWAFGLAAIGVAARAPRRWIWIGAVAIGAVLAMGLHVPGAGGLHETWPLSLLRAPGRALVLVLVAVSVLAAHGFDALASRLRRSGAAGGRLEFAGAAVVALLAFAAGTPSIGSRPDATHRMEWSALLPAELRKHRVDARPIEPLSNMEAQGFSTLRRPCPVLVEGYGELTSVPSPAIAYWLDLGASVTPRWTSTDLVPPPQALKTVEMEPFEPMGRARLFATAEGGVHRGEALRRLRGGERALLLERPTATATVADAGSTGRAEVIEETPNRTVVAVETVRPAWLLVSQVLAPGWTAKMDGAEVPVFRGNVAFPAVRVPEGRHEVRLEYRPVSFRLGAAVSALCLAGALVGLGVRRRYAPSDADGAPSREADDRTRPPAA